jgi:hypothetical protein
MCKGMGGMMQGDDLDFERMAQGVERRLAETAAADDKLFEELFGVAFDVLWPPIPELFDGHVWLYYGFDLSAAGIEGEVADCPFCVAAGRHSDCTGLDADQVDGCWIKFVSCGNCGTHGPWGRTESEALSQWNRRAGGSDGAH